MFVILNYIGMTGGLQLSLNIEEYEHMVGVNLDSGVKVSWGILYGCMIDIQRLLEYFGQDFSPNKYKFFHRRKRKPPRVSSIYFAYIRIFFFNISLYHA